MKCEDCLELYDEWRDLELEISIESELITHLNECPSCSLDYEIRDEALNSLQQINQRTPPLSSSLVKGVNRLGRKRNMVLRRAMTAAAVFFLGFSSHLFFDFRSSLFDSGSFEQATELIKENDILLTQLKEKESANERLKELVQNSGALREEIANFQNRLVFVDDQLSQMNEFMEKRKGHIQLKRQRRGSRISLVRGSSLAQKEKLRNLSLNYPEWSDVVISYLEDEPVPEMNPGIEDTEGKSNPVVDSITNAYWEMINQDNKGGVY